MENNFRKPTKLRGTPGHKYVTLYAMIGTAAFTLIGAALVYFSPDVLSNPNSRLNRMNKWFEDPEQDVLRKKLNKQFLYPPVKQEDTLKSLEAIRAD